MLILGIESSCDETAAAVVRDGRTVLSNVVYSQSDLHSSYGGVVPELASRKHIETIIPVITEALGQAKVSIAQIEALGVTQGPGLIGSILVGLSVAKSLAFVRRIPLCGVNHIEGHVAAVFLTQEVPSFPFVALIVSGGHTQTYLVRSLGDLTVLGRTRDDAAGEAFDKAAKMLGIGYPGGVVIDRIARQGNPGYHRFPRAMPGSLDFSFSGLKTSLFNLLRKRGGVPEGEELADLLASYQEAIADVLLEKTLLAAESCGVRSVVICGGVAANSRLRERFRGEGSLRGLNIFIPPAVLCTDNAAMIAVMAEEHLSRGRRDTVDLNAFSRSPSG